jgi:hypothetical protein
LIGSQAPRLAVLAAAGLGATLLAAGVVVAVLVVANQDPPPRPDEVIGTMTDESDVSEISGAATSGGVVIAVPAAALPDFWRQTSVGGMPEPNQLPYTPFTVRRVVVEAADGLAGPVGRRGRFALRPVSDGHYLVCYAGGITDDGSYQAQGCGQVELRAPGRIEASRGEAGFRVRRAD